VSDRLLILGWHNVAGTYGFPSAPGRGERGIEQQLSILARTANVLALEEALVRMYNGESLPSRAVALTFDDGYRDNLTLAVPMLERLGLPATFFLVPGLLSGEADAWWETIGWALQSSARESLSWEGMSLALSNPHERDAAYSQIVKRLKRRDNRERATMMLELLELLDPPGEPPDLFMDWEGARELVKRGFSVQSHTCSHVVLAQENLESQRRELTEAKQLLEQELDIDISTIAYPHGGPQDYNAVTVRLAGEAGYRWAVTTREAFTTSAVPPLESRRCVIYPERGVIDLLAQLRYLFRAWLQGARS
jgi:peptidoglycan/xylan/chitin deacetylase (PgdA/CDA1 family)